jgi:hypothetical protein
MNTATSIVVAWRASLDARTDSVWSSVAAA